MIVEVALELVSPQGKVKVTEVCFHEMYFRRSHPARGKCLPNNV